MRRRGVLFGLFGSVAGIALVAAARATPASAVLYLTPAGQGDAHGMDWGNAAPFRRIGQIETGESYLFGVPRSDLPLHWTGQQIVWSFAGTDQQPLDLAFGTVDDDGNFDQFDAYEDPPAFRMVGNDVEPDGRPDVGGAPFVVFGAGTGSLRVSGPAFHRAGGAGFFNIDAEEIVRDIVFRQIHARDAGRVIETERHTRLEGLLVEQCSALGLVRGFARFFDLSEAEFRNLDLDADFVDGGGGAVCQIISVVRGRDLTFRSVRFAKAVNSLAAQERGSPYIQGDGLVLEEQTTGVLIEDCHAEDMGDGGFDLKTDGVQLRNCSAVRCKLGIRIWSHSSENLIENCRVSDPVTRPFNEGSCLWIAGDLTARDCELLSHADMSPVRFGDGTEPDEEASLKIEGGVITHADGVSLITGSPGHVELENVLINNTETSGRFYWNGRRLSSL